MNAAQAIAGWALFSAAFGVLSAVLVVAAADINHGLDRWSASLRRTTDPMAAHWTDRFSCRLPAAVRSVPDHGAG
jgi:hypothetical protein